MSETNRLVEILTSHYRPKSSLSLMMIGLDAIVDTSVSYPEPYLGITRKQRISALYEWIDKNMNMRWRNLLALDTVMIGSFSPALTNWLIGNKGKKPTYRLDS